MGCIEIFQESINHSSAYRDFLLSKLGKIPEVKNEEDFLKLPFMSKSDYIMTYSVPELCMDGKTEDAYIWLRSSGTSNKPFFWPRRTEDEKNMGPLFRKLFGGIISTENLPLLIIVGLALGPWGTGMQSSFNFRYLAREMKGLSVVTPGLQNESIIECIERLSPMYKNSLILCYPPFAKIVLEESLKRGIDLPSLKITLMIGGEGITENYRERMWEILGYTEKNLDKVWSLYGSTDFANVGFETPLTIAIRRAILKNNLCEKIFGTSDLPMFFQMIPSHTHFEEVNGELIVSRIQGIPLIRYRTGDHIKIISRKEILDKLKDCGYDAEKTVKDAGIPDYDWNAPFIALYGRIDHAVFFHGAKITVEQVKTALNSPQMLKYFNGNFLVRGAESASGDPVIELLLEKNEALNNSNINEVTEIFSVELQHVQSEFREIRKLIPDKEHVRIIPSEPEVFKLGWKARHFQ